MYELLIKGGMVIDPAQGIHDRRDVGVDQRKVVALSRDIEPGEALRVIDASGKIVTPGLIDIHAHVADGIIDIGVAADEVGVLSGVTAVCDAGSTGFANFTGFKRYAIPQSRTDVFCFLHVCSTGLAAMPELWSWHDINTEAMLKTVEKNRDIIKGIKLRAIASVLQSLGPEAVRIAKRVASETGLPLMVHLGIEPDFRVPEDTVSAFNREMLSILSEGDILSHIYTWKAGGVIKSDGSVLPELKEAIQRGVLLDVAQADSHWSFEIASRGVEQGILPHTMSTDLTRNNINGPVFSLLASMSRFLTVGLTLDQLIEMTTMNPARILGEEQQRGSLKMGMPADISILELTEGDFLFSDGLEGRKFKGNRLLVPRLTLKSGVEIEAHPRFK